MSDITARLQAERDQARASATDMHDRYRRTMEALLLTESQRDKEFLRGWRWGFAACALATIAAFLLYAFGSEVA